MTGTARDRGRRVHEHLQARRGPDPDQPADAAQGPVRPRLQERRAPSSTPSSTTSPSATQKGQPVLVGTTQRREERSTSRRLLAKKGIRHEVLNAKSPRPRSCRSSPWPAARVRVTVATNMAGRGTDIMLGGNAEFLAVARSCAKRGLEPRSENGRRVRRRLARDAFERLKDERVQGEHEEVRDLGGLYVLGTERHESRRIDNQLRGRSGRQGDPGESRFYLSLTGRPDAAVQVRTAADRVLLLLQIPDDVPIENPSWCPERDRQRPGPGRSRSNAESAQERPQVRRRDEPPARGHLRRAPRGARGRRPRGAGPAPSSTTWSAATSTARSTSSPRSGTSTSSGPTSRQFWPVIDLVEGPGRGGRLARPPCTSPTSSRRSRPTRTRRTTAARRRSARRSPASSSAASCCPCSTASGASTSTRWTTSSEGIYLRAYWRSATRWSSTSARASTCSPR